jgi:DNA-binding transcriptional ArsR family regulator
MTPMDPFAAIADRTRRRLLDRLRRGERSAGELAAGLPVSWPAVSQHLRILEGARLVRVRRDGRRRLYSLDAAPLAERCQPWIEEKVRFWRGRLGRLKEHLESGERP